MSCFYVSAQLRVCLSCALSHLRALFHVGFRDGVGTLHASCSVSLCECAVLSLLGRALFFAGVFCGVAHSSCFYWLHAFMLCLVLCGTQLVYFIGYVLSCCHVLCEHVVYEYSH